MTIKKTLYAAVAATLVCGAGLAGAADQGKDAHAGHAMGGAMSSTNSSTSTQMHHTMMEGMKEMRSMQPSGDADRDFAKMMEHHHAQAVKMTQAYLKGAKNPNLRAWAQKSLESQQKELRELRAINAGTGTSSAASGAPGR